MRVSKEKSAENRERILTAASRLFREQGLSDVGVDALAEAAGLTYGSVYSQFGSKDRLAAEALTHAVASSAKRVGEITTLDEYVAQYLSPDHRERRGGGCVLSALACEIPRQSDAVRHSFTDGLKAMIARLTGMLPAGPKREDEALAVAATMIGALVLARGMDDAALSDRILAAARERLGS